MALTYTVVVTQDTSGGETGAQEVAGLSAGTLVAAYLDGEERGRTFIPAQNTPAATFGGGGGNLQASGVTAASVFPAVVSASVVNDSAGNPTGPVKLVLSPGTADVINASSVLNYLLDQESVVITVSGTF